MFPTEEANALPNNLLNLLQSGLLSTTDEEHENEADSTSKRGDASSIYELENSVTTANDERIPATPIQSPRFYHLFVVVILQNRTGMETTC